MEEYKFPTARLEGKGPFAVGMTIFLDKLIASASQEKIHSRLNKRSSTFVINLAGEEPNSDELLLIGEMWRLGRAGQLTINRASGSVNNANNTSIQIQMKPSNNRIVRIKRGREVEEVSIEEIGLKLRSVEENCNSNLLINESSDENVNSTPNLSEDAIGLTDNNFHFQADIHYLLMNGKMEKNPILREKALRSVKEIVNFGRAEIVIHEIPKEVLKRSLHGAGVGSSGLTTKYNSKIDEDLRDLVGRLGNLLHRKLQGKLILFVNHKDNHIEAFYNK